MVHSTRGTHLGETVRIKGLSGLELLSEQAGR